MASAALAVALLVSTGFLAIYVFAADEHYIKLIGSTT